MLCINYYWTFYKCRSEQKIKFMSSKIYPTLPFLDVVSTQIASELP